jgi:hypothetical protein
MKRSTVLLKSRSCSSATGFQTLLLFLDHVADNEAHVIDGAVAAIGQAALATLRPAPPHCGVQSFSGCRPASLE